MHYQPQQNSDSPEDEVVGIEEHVLEFFPIHGEVVACVGCQRVVSNKSRSILKMNDKNRTRSFADKEQRR